MVVRILPRNKDHQSEMEVLNFCGLNLKFHGEPALSSRHDM